MTDTLRTEDILPSRFVRAMDVARVFRLRRPGDTLIAGPFTGELGWELMEWQGYVRSLRPLYRRTVVISYLNSECLYEGCEFWPHSLALKDSGPGYGNWPRWRMADLAARCERELQLTGARIFLPVYLNKMSRRLLSQAFVPPAQVPRSTEEFDIAFHFRNFQREGDGFKNYPPDSAAQIVRYCLSQGWRVCCVGHPELAGCPPGAADRRTADLAESLRTLAAVKIAAGGSSAPMHLASLCDKPIVVWIGPPWNADRYFGSWNPHGNKVFLVSEQTFRPCVEDVIRQIDSAFAFVEGMSARVAPASMC